jgi:aspartokinase
MIEQRKKDDVNELLDKIIKKHRKLADQTIKNSTIKKQLVEKLSSDVSELQELVRGLTLLKEVSARSLDYLISFGERLSDDLVSYALQDLKKKSTALNGKEVGIVTDSNFGESRSPQPGKYQSSIGKKKTDELAVMIDTFKPLNVTKSALKIDDADYPLSWLD